MEKLLVKSVLKCLYGHLQRSNDTFLEQFVTVDETWLIHNDALCYSTDKEIQETKVSRKGHYHSFKISKAVC